jgi:hypothetical protein
MDVYIFFSFVLFVYDFSLSLSPFITNTHFSSLLSYDESDVERLVQLRQVHLPQLEVLHLASSLVHLRLSCTEIIES